MITTVGNIKICEQCWENFNTGYHKNQKFCCYKCFNRRRVKVKDIKCKYCWKVFHPTGESQKYCSRKCGYNSRRKQDKVCLTCWRTFYPKKDTNKYCSRECYWKSQHLNDVTCPICNKLFKPKFRWTKYCSVECRNIGRRLTKEQKEEKDKKNVAVCPQCKESFVKKKGGQIYCSKKCSLSSRGAVSKTNKQFKKLLEYLWYEPSLEFCLWAYYYDFRIWDILIELNPYAFHNSTKVPPRKWAKPKDKLYHYNKYKCAIDSWYRCIMVRDWTSNLLDMLNNKEFHYEWQPQRNYYNPKTKEHFIQEEASPELIDKWFVEIWDCGKETFSNTNIQECRLQANL